MTSRSPQPAVATVPLLAQEWSPLNHLRPEDVTLGSSRRVLWVCSTCSQHWQATVSNRHYRGSGCPNCAQSARRRPRSDLSALQVAPRLAAEWVPELNPGIDLTWYAPHSKTMVVWRCPDCGHEWQSRIATRVAEHTGCPRCTAAARRGRRRGPRTNPRPS